MSTGVRPARIFHYPFAWGEVWNASAFDECTRRILVIGTILALDKWDELRMQVRAALTEGGFSSDDVREVPAANHAFKLAGEIVAQLASSRR